MKYNITAIGWWTWTFNVLYWLKGNPDYNLAAVVSVADSWWSTWELRDEFWILPPGDVRRALVALSQDTGIVRKLFEYRFKESKFKWHTIGNLLLTALADISGDFEEWIKILSEMFDVKWKVIPVTLDDIQIWITLENWEKIIWETNIDIPKHDSSLTIKDAFLVWDWIINPKAKQVIANSDYIIIWPGDLYTSIVPNLLVKWMKETLWQSSAKIIYVCNIMTKKWETNNFFVEDFVNVLEKYIWRNRINYVLVNNWQISEELMIKYAKEEEKKPVVIKDYEELKYKSYKVVERDLINEDDFIRHNPKKLSETIIDFIGWWIK
ncbi:MAG: hypothetical protein ACD_2C00088G0014 [uncultured bacterium (gcode 4)]|uniref:Gluconeogenesis factor n=1 Tax=uncultured bacterium (gcode 4) TaxID=1234023 RepID=K2GHC9_9BACT|nr:MAG: hypothetical protein ACD_2C00088G0014 [uncultured bacterium (gcode 4)]